MIAITNGDGCGMEGDYLAWSNMKIRTTGLYHSYVPSTVLVTNITLPELCRKVSYTEIRARGSLLFWDAYKLCNKMGNSHMFTSISLEHEQNNTLRGTGFWLGIHDMEEEGVWRRVDNGAVTNYTNWRADQPNGGKDDNEDVAVYVPNAWYDTKTEYARGIVCVNYEQPLFRLRGLCSVTNYPVIFSPFNYGDYSNYMMYHSYFIGRKTIIKYDSNSNFWIMMQLSQNGNYTNATSLGMGLDLKMENHYFENNLIISKIIHYI
jgi:hypothetical protein